MSQTCDLPRQSVEDFFASLYGELRRMARARLSAGRSHVLLDTSSLVHEAFLRMQRNGGVSVHDQGHFLAYASTTMRSVIVDFVRQRNTDRRGGGAEHVSLDANDIDMRTAGSDHASHAIHSALEILARVDARLARVVEMRYFEGHNDLEIAASLGVTDRTVRRDWERARLLLADMLER